MANNFGVKIPKVKVSISKIPTAKAPKIPKPPKIDLKPVNIKHPKIDLSIWEGKERQKIPPATRKKVWEKRFRNRKSGKCFVCGERTIYSDAFH